MTYTKYVIFYRQDIPVSENTDHYMFQNLEPNQNYSVSVTMRNGVGEGPPATIYISTTPEPTGTLQKNEYMFNVNEKNLAHNLTFQGRESFLNNKKNINLVLCQKNTNVIRRIVYNKYRQCCYFILIKIFSNDRMLFNAQFHAVYKNQGVNYQFSDFVIYVYVSVTSKFSK